MNESYKKVLKELKEKAKETTDGYLISVSLGVRGDERLEMVRFMEEEGYIEKVELLGKYNIRCKVTQKLLESEI